MKKKIDLKKIRYEELDASESIPLDPFLVQYWRDTPNREIDCLLKIGDTVIAYISVLTYEMRLGFTSCSVLGMGGFAVRPQFRRQGFGRMLLNEVLSRFNEHALCVIDGISSYHKPFGFRPVYAKSYLSVDTDSLLAQDVKTETPMPWEASFSIQAVELFNHLNSNRPFSKVRKSSRSFLPMQASDWSPGELAACTATQGSVDGYCFLTAPSYGERQPFEIRELIAKTPEATRSLLFWAAKQAKSNGQHNITIYEPIDGSAGKALQELGCRQISEFCHDGGWMGKVLNETVFCRAIECELEHRFKNLDLSFNHLEFKNAIKSENPFEFLKLIGGLANSESILERRAKNKFCLLSNHLAVDNPYMYFHDRY